MGGSPRFVQRMHSRLAFYYDETVTARFVNEAPQEEQEPQREQEQKQEESPMGLWQRST